jgi:hypothetical protein
MRATDEGEYGGEDERRGREARTKGEDKGKDEGEDER